MVLVANDSNKSDPPNMIIDGRRPLFTFTDKLRLMDAHTNARTFEIDLFPSLIATYATLIRPTLLSLLFRFQKRLRAR